MTAATRKAPERIEPYSAEWQAKANDLARSWAPTIYPCAHCSEPVVRGYCCGSCGSDEPEGAE